MPKFPNAHSPTKMAPILIRRHFHPPFRALLFLGIFSLSAFLLLCLFHDPLSAPSSALCPSPKCEFQQIFCLIDGKRRIPCIRHKEDVFLPFNGFLRNRFDLSGQFANKTGIFEYFTSDVKSTKSKARVDPLEAFNGVAMRQRVKCLNPQNGLPMTIQWEPSRTFPYFYPVQILQFGFEHFTRNRSLASAKILKRKLGRGKRTKSEGGNLLEGQSEEFGLFPDLDILFFKWRPTGGEARFELIFWGENGRKIKLEFRQSERRECLWRGEKGEELHFVYGLPPANSPVEFLLDLPIFLEKAFSIANSSQSIGRMHQRPFQGQFRPKLLRIFGPSFLEFDSIRQQNAAHQEIFWRVADWLLANQDQKGGWPVPIQRAFDIDQGRHKLLLDPGWHNAMAQGHALSFLSRAFGASGEKRFLEAGHRALDLFEIPAEQDGVLNRLFGLEWFEEYPTWPNGTFVLNGFLYALIGLWDFSAHSNHSLQLFQRGVHSLGQLLPLYDLGQRSAYDLRHIRLGNRPNIARWDYHALHISLLDSIHSITGEPLFGQIAQRWGEYARGTELKHN